MNASAASMTYDFVVPQRIVFGWGRRHELGSLARSVGVRGFFFVGASALVKLGLIDELRAALAAAGALPMSQFMVEKEPTVADIDALASQVREAGARAGDFIVAVGGGATIDAAKAVAAMAVNAPDRSVRDYLEGIGTGAQLTADPLPVIALPTTAGTGAEATRNAVISSADPPVKKSLRDDRLMPRIALVDPELTATAPAAVTAASGMDAITQLLESYISRKAKPIPQALALQGLRLAVPAIGEAVHNSHSRQARERMSHAALLSGMALANSGLGMAHGVAAALGVHCGVPHGVACALMLPAALRANATIRQAELARIAHLIYRRGADVTAEGMVATLIEEIERLCQSVGVPRRLGQVGVRPEQIPAIVADSRGSSMSGNPRDISDEELTSILEQML